MIILEGKKFTNPSELLDKDNFLEVFEYVSLFINNYFYKNKDVEKEEKIRFEKETKAKNNYIRPIKPLSYFNDNYKKITIGFDTKKEVFTTNITNETIYNIEIFLINTSTKKDSKLESKFKQISNEDDLNYELIDELNDLIFKSYSTKLKNSIVKETKLLMSESMNPADFYKSLKSGKISPNLFTNKSVLMLLIDDCTDRQISTAISERKDFIKEYIQINDVSSSELVDITISLFKDSHTSINYVRYISNLLTVNLLKQYIADLSMDNRIFDTRCSIKYLVNKIALVNPDYLEDFIKKLSEQNNKLYFSFGKIQLINSIAYKYNLLNP